MMTVITRVALKPGAEPEWDEAMRERIDAAQGQPGWISGQLAIPVEGLTQRVIVGTWETRADWQAWHEDPAFQDTRQRMEGLQDGPDEMEWFEVVTAGQESAVA
jgi:heme-degrading monooxygenase HmoA